MNAIETLCEILEVRDPSKLNARLIGMKLAPTCGRCGGCGNYSFNQIDGSRCYGCNGKGHVAPRDRDLPAIVDRAREAVASGDLAAYLKRLDDIAFVKRASQSIFDHWKAQVVKLETGLPHHCLTDAELEPAQLRTRNRNALMYQAYHRWQAVQHDTRMPIEERAAILRSAMADMEDAVNA